MDAATEEKTATAPRLIEPGDAERMSHYAPKAAIAAAAVEGTPVTALCGKTWVPTRTPEGFPVCPECRDIYENVVGTGPGAQS